MKLHLNVFRVNATICIDRFSLQSDGVHNNSVEISVCILYVLNGDVVIEEICIRLDKAHCASSLYEHRDLSTVCAEPQLSK